MRTHIIVAAVAVMVATPALAQEFYVVQDSATKKCTVVEQKPTTSTVVVVGNQAFKTRTEAESAVKTITVCTQ